MKLRSIRLGLATLALLVVGCSKGDTGPTVRASGVPPYHPEAL
jgi:hypothetical protein